jgi:hypothetical protein
LFANNYKNQGKNKKSEYFLGYDKITINEDFINFDANCCSDIDCADYFEIITVTINNEVYYHLFLLENIGNKNNYKEIIKEEIKINNNANISDIKYYKNNYDTINDLLSEKIFFIIQLNKIFIIKYLLSNSHKGNLAINICYKYLLDIVEFSEEKIYNIFFLQKKYLYIFTRKNKYIEYNLDLQNMKNNNETDIIKIDEKPKYFKITKFIYDIKPFKSENGFFILITQNPIRPINMNIIYKINYTNLIPIENDFSEGLIIGLRNPRKKVEFINQYNNFLFNKRYNYFINKIFKGQVPGNKDDKMNIEEDSEKSSEMQEEKNDDEDNDNINDDIMNINSEKYKNMEKISIKNNEIIKNEIIDFF